MILRTKDEFFAEMRRKYERTWLHCYDHFRPFYLSQWAAIEHNSSIEWEKRSCGSHVNKNYCMAMDAYLP